MNLYLFMNANKIEKYNNEILKRYINDRLIKIVANPTEQDLKDFGYMELVIDEEPTYDEETQYLVSYYQVIDDVIHQSFRIVDIPVEIESED